MAVTKLWPVRGRVETPIDYAANEAKTANPKWDKSSLQNLTDVMHYAANEEKTEKQFFVSGVNCNPAIARDEFVMVKKQFGKEDGIVAWHGYQSFAEGEVTPEQAHEIGLELARRFWGDRYQVIVATHLNTRHLHNHFIVNSISFKDGKRCREKRWYDLNKVSDEICREHGISVVEIQRGKGLPAQLYREELAGAPTRLNLAKAAVDEAINVSQNLKEFRAVMKAKGYECSLEPNRKYWTIRQKDWQRPIRMYRMGDDYSNKRIMERLDAELESKLFITFQKATLIRVRQYKLSTRGDKAKKVGGLKGLYLHYCYLLGYLPKYTRKTARVSPLLRDDVIKLEQIARETRLLCRENISNKEELADYKCTVEKKIENGCKRQRELRNVLKRKITPEEKEKAKAELGKLNGVLKVLRNERKLVEHIEERSKAMENKIKEVEQERSEVKKDERRR